MGRDLGKLSFEDWIVYVFDHPITDPAWYFLDSDYWDEEKDPAVTLSYLTRLFKDPFPLTAPYTNDQVGQGLWFLISSACSGHMRILADPQLRWETRTHCILAMKTLFEQLFASRCGPSLSELDETSDLLNITCYMWWDLMPVVGYLDNQPAIDKLFLDVMEFSLGLDSDACRESALHGLNHWHLYYKQRVESIIDAFLNTTPGLRPELVAYAQEARRGVCQ